MEHIDHAGDDRVRASDDERERTAERVRAAVAEGRIDLAELDQRLTDVYRAKTRADLRLVGSDLPESSGQGDLVTGREPASGFAMAMFGGFARKGAWVVPPVFTSLSLFGGGRIDLREARFTRQETRIRAFALWGGTKILVPDDIHVEVKGLGLFGVFGRRGGDAGAPGAPRVVVTGLALFGAVVTRIRSRRSRPRP
ncbi:DUF1707 domain-containing protein [Nonomuraea sp. 3-1Str]|uniref:DUF1707 SHOCT-like domain-containing protein n=1 Tax=Nonomuraea sp. 3-1Str TaxID=2929801 RepID=UPI00285DBCE8|nr:DUF1707 domain-containing protein [Nonomuraea sp. 3-1Str]MDR8414708.1 DUF1707 domain-containing protein [Nonomuraea sp. 3-1Str]